MVPSKNFMINNREQSLLSENLFPVDVVPLRFVTRPDIGQEIQFDLHVVSH